MWAFMKLMIRIIIYRFYPIQEGVLSLSGFLYPLDKRRIHIEEIYTTSNSLTEKKGIVRVDEGSFLCVQSNWR